MKTLVAAGMAASLMFAPTALRSPKPVGSTHRCQMASVPDVHGMTAKVSAIVLTSRGFTNTQYTVQKDGSVESWWTVKQQFPSPGVQASQCDRVWMVLGE